MDISINNGHRVRDSYHKLLHGGTLTQRDFARIRIQMLRDNEDEGDEQPE